VGAARFNGRDSVSVERVDGLQSPCLALFPFLFGPVDRLPVGIEDEPGSGIAELDAVASGFVDVEEERLLDRVLAGAGLGIDTLFGRTAIRCTRPR
jgi:hypothetical protein